MSSLKLFLLGPPRVEYEARPVEIQRRKALALLVYLAVTGQSHRRDTLATLLWPDSSQSSARAALRRDISILNKSLGGEWLIIDRETVGLRRGPGFWLDVEQFQQQLAECRTHDHPSDQVCSDCLPLLTEAVALYRDDFLAGFTLSDSPDFDEWQFFQTEGLRQALASALERLVRGHSVQGEAGRELAIPYARRWLALDPLHELAHRQLMQLYAWAGQRAAALRQYEECVRLLEEELGVSPSTETTELYQAIKARRIPPPSSQAGEQGSKGAEEPGDKEQIAAVSDSVLPPPRRAPASRHNLPGQTTTFIGRAAELAAVREQLARPEVRLLTLTGPGGTGKTRLGLQVATDLLDEFADGVFFVSLAPISDPVLVGPSIAETLGVREAGGRLIQELLQEYLQDKQMLLVLDNFEHVLSAASMMTDLLAVAPKLKIMVTSRILLRLTGEWDYPVPPLSLPDPKKLPPLKRLTEYEAVQMFIERARAVKANFAITDENAPAVAEICVRLDGLPLAIELAAARVRVLPPQKMLTQLSNRLQFLTGGARDLPVRQQTLRNTIDWSYDLLDSEEQTLFRRLAVFAGGCTLESVEAMGSVSGDVDVLNGLESLVDKNLLKQTEVAGEPRFGMLETIREYALERLVDAGEAEVIRQRHARIFMTLAEAAELNLYGTEQVAWLNRLEMEHDNLRAALAWSIDNAIEAGLRLAAALGRFWHFRGHHKEGQDWLAKALAKAESERGNLDSARAKALDLAGYLEYFLGDIDRACALSEESVMMWRAVGDRRGLAHAVCDLGVAVNAQGDPARARALLEESIALFRQLEDKHGLVRSLFWHGHVAYRQRDFITARASAEESITLGREVGNISNIAGATDTLGMIAFHQGNYAEAQSLLEESLRLMREVEDKPGIAIMLDLLGGIAYTQSRYEQAKTFFEESLLIWRQLGSQPDVAWSLSTLGYVALHQGQWQQAAGFFEESLVLNQQLGDQQGMARCLAGLAKVAEAKGQLERAARLFGAAEALLKAAGTPLEATGRDRYDRIAATSQADFERNVTAVRAALGEEAFEAAWTEGQAMTLEQAAAYALDR